MIEFTLGEARALLPRLRPLVEALQATHHRLGAIRTELAALDRAHLNNGVVRERRQRDLAHDQDRLAEEARSLLLAIQEAGAELKGIDDGLLDFPTTIDDVPSYWCWRAGEADVEWWHPRDSGFAGRRRVGASG